MPPEKTYQLARTNVGQ